MLEDGLEEIFVNAEVYDGTDIAELTAHNDRMRVNNQPAACSETQGRPTFFCVSPDFSEAACCKSVARTGWEKMENPETLDLYGFPGSCYPR